MSAAPSGGTLRGLRAIVTGGAAGIGRSIAACLAREDASVAIMDLDARATEAALAELEGCGARLALRGSVADAAEVERAVATVGERWGGLDILINNAGISGNRPALDITPEEWRRVTAVNLDGVVFCAQAAGRRMQRQRGGVIINIGSIYSTVAAPNRLSYCATKAAVAMVTKVLAVEWAEHGIRVNAVAPGYVETDLLRALAQDGRVDLDAIRRRTPQGRLAEPADIAAAVLFLCQPQASHITGQILGVDGGWTAYGFV